MTQYASVSPSILSKLVWLCQVSEYAWWSYMLDKLLKNPQVSNKPRFWICLIMAPCTSIMPEHESVCFNMGEYCWMTLKMPEITWIDSSDYARILKKQQYSYNNIFVVTDNFMLEFMAAQFIHLGALLPFYLFGPLALAGRVL